MNTGHRFLPLRRASLLALAMSTLVVLAGCVVAPYGVHYRASTAQPGARDRLAFCGGQVGPVTGLDLQLEAGVKLQASTGTDLKAGIPLRLQLTVPPGDELRFAGPVRVVSGGRELPPGFMTAARRNWPVTPGDEVQPARLRPGTASRDPREPFGELVLYVETTVSPPERLSVQGPALAFGGEPTRLPQVDLARSARKSYLYVRGAPDSAVEEVDGDLPTLRWKGRWLYRDSHAPGELRVWPLDARPFRVDATALQWRDASTGAALPVRLTRAELWFDDRFEFTQPVGASAVETRIALEASLPAGLAEFSVHWPEMARGGQRIGVAPMRFERRSLDGGVQPFNC